MRKKASINNLNTPKPFSIELNESFQHAYDEMEYSNNNVFITGKAGTGKSTLLEYFRDNTKKNIVVLAPTGVAAINVHGQTIHSFFKFPVGITPDSIHKSRGKDNSFKKLDTIVIDEVSMVRADLMDCIDRFMRFHGGDENRPFGGAQVIFIGDLYQLPPVVTRDDAEIFSNFYKSPYFFDAQVFSELEFSFFELDKIYRQKDNDFIQMLNAIRDSTIDDALLEKINNNVNRNFVPDNDNTYIYLTATNQSASVINNSNLKKINGKEYRFKGSASGQFDEKEFPTEKELSLKEGVQVMMLTNDNRLGRWVNGTIARVTKIREGRVSVSIDGKGEYELEPYSWVKYKYAFDEDKGKIVAQEVGSFRQYPIKLAWAITIHKSQGKTFDNVIIDLGYGAFAHGQAYVALSRCTTLEGIVLKNRITRKDIFIEDRIIEFMREVKKKF